MTSTNRFANRVLLLLVGLVLLGAGLAAIALEVAPAARSVWRRSVGGALTSAADLVAAPGRPAGSSAEWLLGTLLLLAVLIGLLVALIVRQGGGHTRVLLVERISGDSTTIIESAVAVDLLKEALHEQPDLVSTRVSSYRIRGTRMLKVAVTCRDGASPKGAGETVERFLAVLEDSLGVELVTLVLISGGLRSEFAARARVEQQSRPARQGPAAATAVSRAPAGH